MTDLSNTRLGYLWRSSLTIVLVLSLSVGAASAQVLQHKTSSELLIKRYEKLVAEGSLLTPDGWKRTSKLFARSEAYPADGEIQLISGPGIIGEIERSGDRAKVGTKWGDFFGTIDSHLRYKPISPPIGSVMLEESFSVVSSRLGGAKGVENSEDWLIEGPLHTRSADVSHALRYVEKMRDQSNDPAIRRNADKTITALKRLIAPGCGSASAC